jgi:hypothetical protein
MFVMLMNLRQSVSIPRDKTEAVALGNSRQLTMYSTYTRMSVMRRSLLTWSGIGVMLDPE